MLEKLFGQYKGLKKEVYILSIGRLVTAMGSFVWPMLTFLLTIKLGFSDALATALLACLTLIQLPASILGGKMADKFSRKNIIIVFDCITVSLYILAAILPVKIYTVAIIFIASIGQTLEGPAYDAFCADFSTEKDREKAFSLLYLAFNIGYIVGAAVAGTLFTNHIGLAFIINGGAIITSTILIWIFVFEENAVGGKNDTVSEFGEYEKPVEHDIPILKVLKDRKVIAYFILIGCFSSLATGILGTILPLQLKEGLLDNGPRIYGFLQSLNGGVVILFTPILTLLLKKFTELPKCSLGMLLFVTGMILFSQGCNLWPLFIGMFIYTLGEVVSVLGHDPYSSRRIPESHRGRISGVSGIVSTIFHSLTEFMVSFILLKTASNYKLIWTIFIIIGFISVALYMAIYKLDKKTFPILYEERKKENEHD